MSRETYCQLSGTLPSSLTNLRQLSVLSFHFNAGLYASATEAFRGLAARDYYRLRTHVRSITITARHGVFERPAGYGHRPCTSAPSFP